MDFVRLYKNILWWRRGELNSRPRKVHAKRLQVYSAYVFSPGDSPADGHPSVIPPFLLVRAPAGANANQPENSAPRRSIRRQPLRRDGAFAANLPRLCSVGVFVIVVGNYFVAAFYEASGASTCCHGFQHPRRNQCAPIAMALEGQSEISSRGHSPRKC